MYVFMLLKILGIENITKKFSNFFSLLYHAYINKKIENLFFIIYFFHKPDYLNKIEGFELFLLFYYESYYIIKKITKAF